MPDLKISELPRRPASGDTDIVPFVQNTGGLVTRRASLAQLRSAVLAERSVHVRDFGAVGNGVADDGPAIQAAINALTGTGGIVRFGPRTYRIGTGIVVSGVSVRLQGAGFTEGGGPGDGTWLVNTTPAVTPLTFTGPAARGSAVRDIAVREAHGAALTAAWAPTAYDFFFRVVDCFGGVDFDNVLLSGVNKGILCRNSGRTDFRRIRGQVFTTGIELDEAYDVCRIMNLHLWPFWSTNDFVLRWQQNNGDALLFRRCDGVFVDQSFVLGYRSMFRFSSSAAGVTTKFSIGQAYAGFVRHGLWLEGAGTDGQVDAMTVQCELWNAAGAPLPGSVGVFVNTTGTRLQIGQLRIDDAEDNAIRLEGHSNRIDLSALRVVNFNLRNNGAAAIHLGNAAAGVPNRVNLAGPPLLETAIMGPLLNAGTNGSLGVQGPAGSVARPGLAVGTAETGFAMPLANALTASVGGAEMWRATTGSLSLGGAAGSHGFEVSTPGNAVNRPRALGSAAGSAVALQAVGADASLELSIQSKGAAPITFQTGGSTQAQVGHVPGAVNSVLLMGGATGATGRAGLLATGADAHVSLVLAPKGSGALIAQFPDAAAGGGNERGANAVDLQTRRNSAIQVASGAQSTLAGGQDNTASGAFGTVAGGAANLATNFGATVSGGRSNNAGGQDAWIPGGFSAATRGLIGRGAWASGQFATPGDAQSGEFVLRRSTTDATVTRLTADNTAPGATNTLNLPNNGTYRLKLLVVAHQTAGSAGTAGDCASWEANVLVKRGATAASTILVGGTAHTAAPALAAITPGAGFAPGIRDAAAAAWLIALAADTANGGLAVSAAGEPNKTIRWVARILSVEATA
jgi:hypothetical protein